MSCPSCVGRHSFNYLWFLISGTFLVQFFILVLLIGVPWCFMETALGQYSGRGSTALGDMVPIGKGDLKVVLKLPLTARSRVYIKKL